VWRERPSACVISRKLKLGGLDKCLGGVNMRKAQIYIENIKKNRKITLSCGGVFSQLGGLYPLWRGCKNITSGMSLRERTVVTYNIYGSPVSPPPIIQASVSSQPIPSF